MNCGTITKQLSLMLYGEVTFDEEEQIHQHLEACPSCRSEFERVKSLHRRLNAAEMEVPPGLLQDCRRQLRITVSALHEAGLAGRPARLGGLLAWWDGLRNWKPAAAVAMVAAGFFAGQLTPRTALLPGMASSSEPAFSRVRFVQPEQTTGKVRLIVEEVRQRTLSGSLEDDRIRSLLVAAAREASDPGIRVETMDLLKSQSEAADVRRALLAALQSDTNPGVRLKALEALRGSADDSETRRVLAQVLLTDENPGVRTQAIDLLTQRRERAMVGVLQELMAREENNYVRLKCQKALSEMNASVETF